MLIIAIAAINYRFKQHCYEIWVEDFESQLGLNVPDDDKEHVLPLIFREGNWSIEDDINRYKQIKFNN